MLSKNFFPIFFFYSEKVIKWCFCSEILRVIDSLQLTDRIPQIATPANWVPGDKVMIAPTVGDEDADKIFENQVDYIGMPSGKNYVRTTNNY